jgi:hypothetical protein
MIKNGIGQRAAHRIWSEWNDYPHRCLTTIDDFFAGKIPDPELNILIRHQRTEHGRPINYSIERNDADECDRRATRPCACGGTLFDWGAGDSEGYEFVTWRCNACPDVFTEYMTHAQLYELRQQASRRRLTAA